MRLAWLVLAAAGLTLGAEPLATTVDWQPVWQAPGPIRLAVGDEPTQATVELPALPTPPGRVLVLRFRARLHTERPAGWNNYLGLALNGTPLDRRTAAGALRVLNRRPSFATTHPNYPLVDVIQPRNGIPSLQVFFGPPDTAIEPAVQTDRDEGYWYLLDIGDAGRTDAANTLALTNSAIARYWNGQVPAGLEMLVDDLAVGSLPAAQIERLRNAHLARRERLDGPSVRQGQATVRAVPGGGLQVEAGQPAQVFFVESSFSFPREGGRGENVLACAQEPSGEPGWQPAVAQADGALTVTAEAGTYRLERTLKPEPSGRFTVTDTLTNKTAEVLGVAVRHAVIAPEQPVATRINGLDDAGHGPGRFPEHPTLHVQAQAELGLLLEDNAQRLQHGTRAMLNEVSAQTDRLGLAPRETCTLRWALYPGDGDYWRFINAVRRDWDVNFTVDGPWDFFDVRTLATEQGREQTRQLLARKRLRVFALVPWFEYYNGWGYARDEFRTMMTDAMRFLRGLVPDAKFLACTETNLCPVPLSFFGDTIPADWPIGRDKGGKYGQPATPAMTAKIDASPWRDSVVRGPDGNALIDCWYVQHYAAKPAVNLMVYPTLTNHRHQQMLEQLGWLLDTVGFDGVYIDQFSQAYNVGTDRFTHGEWDGRTVTLDANGRVADTLGDLGLLSAEARRAWVQFGLDRGKIVVANSQPAVNELQSLRAFRFMETQGYDPLTGELPYQPALVKGQLATPIGLGHSFPATAGGDFFLRTVVAHLRFGMLYYHYVTNFPADGDRGGEYGPVNRMFPFTPVELHDGWVLGEERLITCRSGEFAWPHEREPRVTVFDSRGRERAAETPVQRRGDGWAVTVRLRDGWEVAVVE